MRFICNVSVPVPGNKLDMVREDCDGVHIDDDDSLYLLGEESETIREFYPSGWLSFSIQKRT